MRFSAICVAAAACGSVLLSACGGGGGGDSGSGSVQNNSGGSTTGTTSSSPALQAVSNTGNTFPNLGTASIYSAGLKSFVCKDSLAPNQGASVSVGANGLVGAGLNTLLNTLGAQNVSNLLASVSNPQNIIDGDLSTYAGFSMPIDLLQLVATLDAHVKMPSGETVPAGDYAVFAISSPASLLSLNLGLSVTVKTYKGGTATGDQITTPITNLNLLGLGGTQYGFVGFQATQPYDEAVISVGASGLSIDLANNAVDVYELCLTGSQ